MENKKRKRGEEPKQGGLLDLNRDLYFQITGFLAPQTASCLRQVFGNRFPVDWKIQAQNAWKRRLYWYKECQNKKQLCSNIEATSGRLKKELRESRKSLKEEMDSILDFRREIAQLQRAFDTIKQDNEELEAKLKTAKSHIEDLQNQIEGFESAARYLRKRLHEIA